MAETSLVQFKLPKNVKHKEAKKLICNLVRDMNERGELAPFDVALLHRMATAYEMYLICVDKITTDGMTMTNKKGEMVKRPEVNILKENWSQFLELAKEFGLTAMSKRKLKTMKNIDEAIQSPLKEYLREHQV
ncbi:phage terminase small subunit P27 family [Phocaeicola barnesiae]|jgi:P27 family predicted phage terminase small subunit|uniref:Phage terminase small subunit P27 family n=1 Tax=Phocaeicola barnesiae TaxID=376804 RepID=A0AAW5N6E4_9BACT|nr:phage terminase small subunit P27 family [Phocaeicola barnesiae]MCR8874315.1 phage terminase small subunit P27 family [Phocaeicola barnesiae]